MLEGEGLFNDVAALVLYQVAIAAVVAGSFSPGSAALKLLLAAGLALVVGFAFGWGISRLSVLLGNADPRPSVLISVLAPTAVYALPRKSMDRAFWRCSSTRCTRCLSRWTQLMPVDG